MDQLFLFFIAVVVHEFGHLLSFFILGLRMPKVKLSWGAILLESDDLLIHPYWMSTYVSLGGILVGMLPLWLMHAESATWAVYITACLIDISEVWYFFAGKKKNWGKPLYIVVQDISDEILKRAMKRMSRM